MKIRFIENGKTGDMNASYGMRLIEQGKAVLVEEAPKRSSRKESGKTGEAHGAEG